MAELPQITPDMKDRESNLQEDSTQINPNGVDAQDSAVPGSCSAIDDANTKTDSSRTSEEEDRDDDYDPESDGDSIITQPPYQYLFDPDMFQVVMRRGEDAGFGRLVSQPSRLNPSSNQIARSYQAMNPHQQLARTDGQSTSSTSHRNNFLRPFGMQIQLSPYAEPYRPQNTYPQYPVANQIPNGGPMQQPQMILPTEEEFSLSLEIQSPYRNPNRFDSEMNPQQQLARTNHLAGSRSSTSHRNNLRQPFGMASQLSPNSPPWRPQNTYPQYPVANQIPNLVPTQQRQMILPRPAFADHNYASWGPQNTYPQDPLANQIPNLAPHNRAPWIPQIAYQQHPMGNEMANLFPTQTMRPPMQHSMIIPWHVEQHYWAMRPQFRSDQTMISPSEQPRSSGVSRNYVNPQQHFVLPELNHQQMQQPTQSQGFDAGASSEQAQDQQQPSQDQLLNHQQILQLQTQTQQPTKSQGNHQQMLQLQTQTQLQRFEAGASSEQGRDQQQARSNDS